MKWDENEINKTLINDYEWELAPDTTTTWRIGDGTAAFYNYVYKLAGFTEHDTLEVIKLAYNPRQALYLVGKRTS